MEYTGIIGFNCSMARNKFTYKNVTKKFFILNFFAEMRGLATQQKGTPSL
jgi:hypothetical protein